MFEKYDILEKTEDSLKLRHISTGDISMRYRAICSRCGCERGWKKAYKKEGLCRGCAQKSLHVTEIDQSTYPNVDFSTAIYKKKKNGSTYPLYMTICPICETHSRYVELSRFNTPCRSCSKKLTHVNRSPEVKETIAIKISMAQTNQSEFNGFRNTRNEIDRNIFKSRQLSKSAFERDNFTCKKCHNRGVKLHAHHINGFDIFPEQRFLLDNLITLCESCHVDFHSIHGRGGNTENQLKEWL
jgi:5-methylcytosine-specific restriction endonuclease McrA